MRLFILKNLKQTLTVGTRSVLIAVVAVLIYSVRRMILFLLSGLMKMPDCRVKVIRGKKAF